MSLYVCLTLDCAIRNRHLRLLEDAVASQPPEYKVGNFWPQ